MKLHPAEGPDPTRPTELHRPVWETRGASNPWGWAAGRGSSGCSRAPDPVEHYTLEWTPIPDDHPSQEQQR